MRIFETAKQALASAESISKESDTYVSVFFNGEKYGVDFTYENGQSIREKNGFFFLFMILHNWSYENKPTVNEIETKAQTISVESAAALLGKKGGQSTSEKKIKAAKENGKKGGRPKKDKK